MARRAGKPKATKSAADKQSKKRLALKIILITFIVLLVAAVSFVIWVASGIDFSFADGNGDINMELTSVLYWQNPDTDEWEKYEYLSSKGNRIWADIDTIPNYLEDAFIAIEDQRFLKHSGVDWKRTGGAVFNEIFKGGSSYGGSSITQQLVKNVTGERDRKYMRKIKEIIRALVVETKYSKQQILELYLNAIYLGQGCNGVEAASQIYFNKSVNELTLAEAASIAGITQYPELYDPYKNLDRHIEKQRLVLSKMLELGYITQTEHDNAVEQELKFERGVKNNTSQSYFADAIVEELVEDLCSEYEYTEAEAINLVYNGGLKIYVTADKDMQDYAESVFANDNNFPSVGGDELQAAMTVIEPETGYVKAIVGGRGEKTLSRGLNRATVARQPGSAIKPIAVYAPAIDMGLITPDSMVDNTTIDKNGWVINGAGGSVSVRSAVSRSLNVPAIKVLEKLGVDRSYDYMVNRMHFSTLVSGEDGSGVSDKGLAQLALGGLTDGVTTLEMAAAYATFPNDGVYIEPTLYTRVEDNQGKTVLTKEQSSNTVFKSTTAYHTNQLLKGVVTSGTAAGNSISGIDTAGKTGTTGDERVHDRYFAGYTPYYACAVWVGYDDHDPLPRFSVNPALSLWSKVMKEYHKGLPSRYFSRPEGMSGVTICSYTGLLASDNCYNDEGESTAVTRYYDKNNAPRSYCSGEHGKTPEEVEDNQENDEDNNESTGPVHGPEGYPTSTPDNSEENNGSNSENNSNDQADE